VEHGWNGLLCEPRSSADLAEKMERMLLMTPMDRAAMGRHGRDKVEREFDEQFVIQKYLDALARLEG
jgi:glycosyltransferase involved in cell wall biosynthesis